MIAVHDKMKNSTQPTLYLIAGFVRTTKHLARNPDNYRERCGTIKKKSTILNCFRKNEIYVHHIFALQSKPSIHQIKPVVHSFLAIY